VTDAKRVDTKKFPKFVAGQNCTNCALFQGKPNDKAGGCPLFAGKQVAGAGWCSAWVKKARSGTPLHGCPDNVHEWPDLPR